MKNVKQYAVVNRALSPVCAIVLALLIPAHIWAAYDFSAVAPSGQTLYYNILDDSSAAVVYPYYFFSDYYHGCEKPTGSLQIPAQVAHDGVVRKVVGIGEDAFVGCAGLVSVVIPNSVASIGANAFGGCTSLVELVFDADSCADFTASARPFKNCPSLATVIVGNGVRRLPKYFMRDAGSLTTLVFNAASCADFWSASLGYSIDGHPFWNCPSLTTVTIGDGVRRIPAYFMYQAPVTALAVSNSVSQIGQFAFYGCAGLTSLELPSSVDSIGYYAFASCTGLASVVIPSSMTRIESGTFSSCSSLASIVIPNSVTSIGPYAFNFCEGLTEINFPQSLTCIERSAFRGCTGITSVLLPGSVVHIGAGVFSYCDGLETIEVEAGNARYDSRAGCNAIITTVGDTLVAGCKCTVIPGNVAVIGEEAFMGHSHLSAIGIPQSVAAIGGSAFNGCSSLASVVIPASVSRIDSAAFYKCTALATVTVRPPVPPAGRKPGFPSSTLIVIPCGTLSAYHTAWGSYTYYEELAREFTVASDNGALGTAEILQRPNCTSIIGVVRATPASDCVFLRWSDGSSDNPHLVFVTTDTTFTAYFSIDSVQGIEDAADMDYDLHVVGRTVVIGGAAGRRVLLCTIDGRILHDGLTVDPATIVVPAGGIYLLRVGNGPARKVVVR